MTASFAANRDMKVEASETSAGVYALRTRGLAGKRRPELEIAGVPQGALQGAAGVLNMIAEYSVNVAEIFADQTVGNVLAVGDEGRDLLLAVRAVAAEGPSGGVWSKLTGGGKGVLRLADVVGEARAPLTAIATMLVHRAAVRRAKADEDGARAELEGAIAVMPGDAGAGKAPSIGGADGTFNWQNHLAYLELAELDGDDLDAAAVHFGAALARSHELARVELGATFDAVRALTGDDVAREAARIIEHNLAEPRSAPGPSPSLGTFASPIWELDDDDQAVRRASVVPAALRAHYYDGDARERLVRSGAALAVAILEREREAPWRAAWVARGTRALWTNEQAPIAEAMGPARPASGVVSAVLADVARAFRAGATDAEILARYGERGDATSLERRTFDEKLATLGAWEGDQYLEAMTT